MKLHASKDSHITPGTHGRIPNWLCLEWNEFDYYWLQIMVVEQVAWQLHGSWVPGSILSSGYWISVWMCVDTFCDGTLSTLLCVTGIFTRVNEVHLQQQVLSMSQLSGKLNFHFIALGREIVPSVFIVLLYSCICLCGVQNDNFTPC